MSSNASSLNFEDGEEEEEEIISNKDEYTPEFIQIELAYKKHIDELQYEDESRALLDDYMNLFNVYKDTFKNLKEQNENYSILETDFNEYKQKYDLLENDLYKKTDEIDCLKKQIENVYQMSDAAQQRELAAQETIENLRSQITRLTNELEMFNTDEEDIKNEEDTELMKNKENLQREIDRLNSDIEKLKRQLSISMSYQKDLESKYNVADNKICEMTLKIDEQCADIARLHSEKDSLNEQIRNDFDVIEDKEVIIEKLNKDLSDVNEAIVKLRNDFNNLTIENSNLTKQIEQDTLASRKLKDDYVNLKQQFKNITEQLNEVNLTNKTLETKINELKRDNLKFSKTKEQLEKQLQISGNAKANIINDRDKLRGVIGIMEIEIDLTKKELDNNKRIIDSLEKEKELLNKNLKRAEALSLEYVKMMQSLKQIQKKLENDVENNLKELNKLRKLLSSFEKERDRLMADNLELNNLVKEKDETVKLNMSEINELKKLIVELENKLRHQQNLFEVVLGERNGFQKQFQEMQTRCNELKIKLKMTTTQTEQLGEKLAMKDVQITKHENALRKSNKENESLKSDVSILIDTKNNLKSEIKKLTKDIRNLTTNVQDLEKNLTLTEKKLNEMQKSKEYINQQLNKSNEQISLLNDKINILQIALDQGETSYNQRLDDIRCLKNEIKMLRDEKDLLTKTLNSSEGLQIEIFHLERELVRVQLKCRALEEEMQTPLNVHRWRKLEGTEPEHFELQQKTEILQKRILTLTEQLQEKDRVINETNEVYKNLKGTLAKQTTSNDLKNDLTKAQCELKKRGDKLKVVIAELNMFESKATEFKLDLERANKQLYEFKQKYYDLKSQIERKGKIVGRESIAKNLVDNSLLVIENK